MKAVSTEEFVNQIRNRMQRINVAMSAVQDKLWRSANNNPDASEVFDHCSRKMNFLERHLLVGPDTEARRNVINNYLQEVEVLLFIDE